MRGQERRGEETRVVQRRRDEKRVVQRRGRARWRGRTLRLYVYLRGHSNRRDERRQDQRKERRLEKGDETRGRRRDQRRRDQRRRESYTNGAFTPNWFGVVYQIPPLFQFVWAGVNTPSTLGSAVNNAPWFAQKGGLSLIQLVPGFVAGENEFRKKHKGKKHMHYYWLFDCEHLMKSMQHHNLKSLKHFVSSRAFVSACNADQGYRLLNIAY